MPTSIMSPTRTQPQSQAGTASYGQVIEYCPGKLYLASYTHAPNDKTPFPYPSKSQSPSKRSSRAQIASPQARSGQEQKAPIYFSVDAELLYNAFHLDFGPLHIGHLYRFAVAFHDVLGDPEHETRPVVFWSMADSRSRANAACLLACYMVMIQGWPPHLALAPIAQMDPPPMPFRDAGYSQADYIITIQDVVYGIWRAKEAGLVDLRTFDLKEYEQFERVDEGDFNWVTPDFLAFASPQTDKDEIKEPILPTNPLFTKIPTSVSAVRKTTHIKKSFRNVLTHFHERNIGLVVRLNSKLYSSTYFTQIGIQHLDMIFDDGTCPDLSIVREFINLAHEMITVRKKGIAVHCKAGLGRTGCLIGAYLIYRYGFTANELIAYMRFMRPGMVVGPQQHWLHITQGTFREWWFKDTLKPKYASAAPLTPTRNKQNRLVSNGQAYTPPNGSQKRAALGEITSNDQKSVNVGVSDDSCLPAPTPGQPRKTSKAFGANNRYRENEHFDIHPDTEVVTMQRHVKGDGESEEEYQVRIARRSSSKSPRSVSLNGGKSKRAVSCTSTTVTTTEWSYPDGSTSDVENEDVTMSNASPIHKPARTPLSRTASGKGEITVGKSRTVGSSPLRKVSDGSGKTPAGVRKTSGRVGSLRGEGVVKAR